MMIIIIIIMFNIIIINNIIIVIIVRLTMGSYGRIAGSCERPQSTLRQQRPPPRPPQ